MATKLTLYNIRQVHQQNQKNMVLTPNLFINCIFKGGPVGCLGERCEYPGDGFGIICIGNHH